VVNTAADVLRLFFGGDLPLRMRRGDTVRLLSDLRNGDTPELVRFPVCDGEEVGILPVVFSVYLRHAHV